MANKVDELLTQFDRTETSNPFKFYTDKLAATLQEKIKPMVIALLNRLINSVKPLSQCGYLISLIGSVTLLSVANSRKMMKV